MKNLLKKYRHWANSLSGYQLCILILNLLILGSVWATFLKLDAWLGTMYRYFFKSAIITVLTFALVGSAMAQETPQAPPPPDPAFSCIVAVCVVVVGGVMVYGVYKLCQRIPTVNTNPPPEYAQSPLPIMVLNDSDSRVSIPTFSEIQSSTNLVHWSEAITFKFDDKAACIVYQRGLPIETNIPYMINGQLRYFVNTRIEPKPSALFRMVTQ